MKLSREKTAEKAKSRKGEILFLLLLLACILPNLVLLFREGVPVTVRILNVILPSAIYILLLSFIRRAGWGVVFFFPVMFLSAFQIVLIFLSDEPVISVDMWLNIPTTNSREIGELLHSLVKGIAVVVVVFIPPLVTGIVGIVHKWEIGRKATVAMRYSATVLFVAAFPLIVSLASRHDYLFPLNALENLDDAARIQMKVHNRSETSKDFRFHSVSTHDPSVREIHVVVVGETSRADNWQILGYGKRTNPALEGVDGLISFGNVLSESNTTHKSVPLLLSHLTAHEYGDSINMVKGIESAFREAGYHTAYFSNQQRNHSYIDFFGEEADTCVFTKDHPERYGNVHDLRLLGLLRGQLARGDRKLFVVLHTYGSHFNYNDRYPVADRIFLPDRFGEASPKWRREMINAYDNTIVSTSRLLREIIDLLKNEKCRATLTYTSDHGEDIFDDGKHFLHASSVPSYHQLHVPLLIWLSHDYLETEPQKAHILRSNRESFISSSESCFHTVLDMAGIRTPYLDRRHSVASTAYMPPKPVFLNDKNKAVPVEKSGISTGDIKRVSEMVDRGSGDPQRLKCGSGDPQGLIRMYSQHMHATPSRGR